MKLIEWNEEVYGVNVKEFDAHHRQLVDMINILHEKMIEGKGREIIPSIIEKLKSYISYHFQAEEQSMQQHLYPDFEKHKNEHDKFVKHIEEFNKKLAEGDYKVSVKTYSFLKDWLLKHILNSDKKLGDFLIKLK